MLSPARAQVQPGQIGGLVTRDVDGAPLPGTTVVVSGPALQGEQTEVTDRNGRYLITQLPSGDGYVVRFYFADLVVERPGVRVGQNKTLTINVQIATQKQERQVQVIRERAPNVDTASASSGVELNQELLQSSALRGRTFESALQLALRGYASFFEDLIDTRNAGNFFCGADCSEGQACPRGYGCQDVIVVLTQWSCTRSNPACPINPMLPCTTDADCKRGGVCGKNPGEATGFWRPGRDRWLSLLSRCA